MNRDKESKMQLVCTTILILLAGLVILVVIQKPTRKCKGEETLEKPEPSIPDATEVIDVIAVMEPSPCDPALDSSICFIPELQEEAAAIEDEDPIPEGCQDEEGSSSLKRKFILYYGSTLVIWFTIMVCFYCYKTYSEYQRKKENTRLVIHEIPLEACNSRAVIFTFGPPLEFSDSESDSDDEDVDDIENRMQEAVLWC